MSNSAVAKASQAVQSAGAGKTTTIQDLIEQSAKQLGKALPSHMKPERIVRIALTTLRLNPKLYECDPKSFMGALFQSAQLGLEPNVAGEAWIIPYRVQGRMVAQFQVGAQGWIKLYWNHQNAVSIQIEKVHKNDEFQYDLASGSVKHVPPVFMDDRGEVIGYYAYATLANGGRAVKVMSKREAEEFAKKYSKCWDAGRKAFMAGTPWAEHFDAMAMKTVGKQLCKILPKSIEIQKALSMDETVKTTLDVDMTAVPSEDIYSDTQPAVTHEPPAPAAPAVEPQKPKTDEAKPVPAGYKSIKAIEGGKCSKCQQPYNKGMDVLLNPKMEVCHFDCA